MMEDWPHDLIEDCLPPSQDSIQAGDAPSKTDAEYHPVILDFKASIEGDPYLFMLFHQMFDQRCETPAFQKDVPGSRQAQNYEEMLASMNAALRRAPEFNVFFACPITAIIHHLISTPAGKAAFLSPAVNNALHKILKEWSRYLSSKDSRYVLNKDPQKGWLGRDAMVKMPSFETDFVCDPTAQYYGFNSWDDFFTRRLRSCVRPIDSLHNDNAIINACESAPFRLAHNLNSRDIFWLKSQPYSVEHMLAGDPLAQCFSGGSVYQAYLDETSYHRWHSPVTGIVVRAFVQEGTYYSRCPAEDYAPGILQSSQAYLAQVATRAIVFLQAENSAIGLICFLAVGMLETSSSEITVYEGQKVRKGDELGTFHYGGSTYCLLCRPGVCVNFDLRGQTPGIGARNIPINATIATVVDEG